jgi:RHS repeat-associated protein
MRYSAENASYSGMWLYLYRTSGTLSRFPMYDSIGSARGLLDASGTATDWYELDTFGKQVSSSGTTPNPYRFGAAWGYVTDPSGFLQLGRRFYWPEVGRFVSQDPAGEAADWYPYVGNNPAVAVDPEGLFKDLPADWKKCLSDTVGGNTIFGKTAKERVKYKKMARCIIFGESGDDPKAKNPNSSARGLMQILKCHDEGCTKMLGHPFNAFDPCDNIKCGVAIVAGAVKHGNLASVYVSTNGKNRAYNKCMKGYVWK